MAATILCLARLSEADELRPNATIERELAGGKTHVYHLTLAAGQYLRVVAEQRGIDLQIAVLAPDGKELISVDYLSTLTGHEPVSVIAEAEGSYRLAISPLHEGAVSGRYEIRIAELREATPEDKTRIKAQGAFAEARKLKAQGTAESYQRSLEKYEQALSLWQSVGEKWHEAITLNEIAEISSGTGKLQLAVKKFDQALVLWQTLEDRVGQAQALRLLGEVYVGMGEPQRAVALYNQALELWRAAGDRKGEADTLNVAGIVCRQLGQLQMALGYYSQSLEARRVIADRDGQAQTLYNIGLLHFSLGENRRALAELDEALKVRSAMSDSHGAAIILDLAGFIYTSLGDFEKALEFYNRALPLNKETGDVITEALILQDVGTNYQMMGEPGKALKYLNQALSMSQSLQHRQLEATVLGSIGAVFADLGNNPMALSSYNQALELHRRAGRIEGQVTALIQTGRLYAALGDVEKASSALLSALTLSRSIGFRRGEARALLERAHVELAAGRVDVARADLEAALPIIESTRTDLASQDLRASYLALNRKYYEQYIAVLMRQHQTAAAFEASERGRARVLLEALAESQVGIRQGADPELLERERTLQQQINATDRRRIQLLSRKDRAEQVTLVEKELNSLLSDYQDVEASIRATSPRYVALTQPEPLALREIQQQVLDEDTLLLEYALGEDRSYLWLITPASIEGFELPKRTEIEMAAKRARELATLSQKREFSRQAELSLAAISRMLVGPVAHKLGNKRILIVADGALQYIPFQALPTPGTESGTESAEPLVARHEVVNLPSASVMAVLRQEVAGRKQAARTIAVLSDPVFHANDPRVRHTAVKSAGGGEVFGQRELTRSATDSGLEGFQRLTFSRKEAESIEKLVAPGEILKAVDFAASKPTAMSEAVTQFRIVHFATHGLINSRHPELSGIVLSLVDEQGRPQDGFLRAHEIYNLRLNADLVVLSACQTALGKEVKGEGLMGLTRGFMYAGSPRVVASLWDVKDEAAAELMKRFYRGVLKEGLRPSAALRAAEVSMWKEKRWESPYYWAAFVIQGEWR